MSNVQQMIDDSQSYATGWAAQADSFINRVAEISTTGVDVQSPVDILDPDQDATDLLAVIRDYAGERPQAPVRESVRDAAGAPPPVPVSGVSADALEIGGAVPVFEKVAPTLHVPSLPTVTYPGDPGPAPAIVLPSLPEAPNLDALIPAAPAAHAVTIPTMPAVEFPTFAALPPVTDLAPPSQTFAWAEGAYTSVLLDEAKRKILDDLLHGGYGIDAGDEDRLWSRARDREAGIANAARQEAASAFARRGFVLPPGALYAAQEAASQVEIVNAATLSREIAIKRADLAVQNRQFAITTALEVEKTLLSYHGAAQERMLNSAKYLADAGIAYYNAQVEQARLRLQSYQAQASVFETLMRATVEKLNVWRGELEGAKLVAEVDRAQVERYRALLGAAETMVGMYRSRLDAVGVLANLEKLKVDAFRASVDTYTAQVQAQNIKMQAYEAQVRGETAKVQLYGEEVRAFGARVEAFRTTANVRFDQFKAQVEAARHTLERHNAEVAAWKASADLLTEDERSKLEFFKTEMQGYQAGAGVGAEAARVKQSAFAARIDLYRARVQEALERARFELEEMSKNQQMRLSAAEYGANFYSTVIASAMNSINAMVGLTKME